MDKEDNSNAKFSSAKVPKWLKKQSLLEARRKAQNTMNSVSHKVVETAKKLTEPEDLMLEDRLLHLRAEGKEPHMEGMNAPEPPWVEFSESEEERKRMKYEMRMLVLDKNTFLDFPPKSVNFKFDIDANIGMCLALIAQDPNVSVARKHLVPLYLSDYNFWRNYFYKISIIRRKYISMRHGRKSIDAQQQQLPTLQQPTPTPSTTMSTTVQKSNENVNRSKIVIPPLSKTPNDQHRDSSGTFVSDEIENIETLGREGSRRTEEGEKQQDPPIIPNPTAKPVAPPVDATANPIDLEAQMDEWDKMMDEELNKMNSSDVVD